jgi:hypothetical protein
VKRRIFLRTLAIASHEEPLSDRMTSYDLSAPASVHLSVTCVPLTEAETTGATMGGGAEFAVGKFSTKATVATCKTINTTFVFKSSRSPRSQIAYAFSGSSPPSSAHTGTLFTPHKAQRFAHKSLRRRYTLEAELNSRASTDRVRKNIGQKEYVNTTTRACTLVAHPCTTAASLQRLRVATLRRIAHPRGRIGVR